MVRNDVVISESRTRPHRMGTQHRIGMLDVSAHHPTNVRGTRVGDVANNDECVSTHPVGIALCDVPPVDGAQQIVVVHLEQADDVDPCPRVVESIDP